jgi:hypothetical protein
MRAMIPARKLKIQEAQAAAMAAATPAEVTQVVATPEGVVVTRAVVILGEVTPEAVTLEVEDPVEDKTMAGGTPRLTKRYRR